MKTYRLSIRRSQAFSLTELLVATVIIGLLTTISIPAFNRIVLSSNLTQSGQQLVDQFMVARQSAISQNRAVELRLYIYKDLVSGKSSDSYAIQSFIRLATSELAAQGVDNSYKPCDKVYYLPTTIQLNSTSGYSTILDSSLITRQPAPTNQPLPRVKTNYEYIPILFYPDGSTNLDPTKNWFLTLTYANGETSSWKNFYTIQVDSLTGAVKTYRP